MNHVNFTHKLVLRFSQFICIVILLMGDGIISLTPRQHVSANSSAVIDFKTLLNVPIELQQPIRSAVNSVALESLPDSNLAVSAVNQSQNWLYAILVANHAIDKHWEEASDKDFVEVLAHRQADGGWISFVKGTQGFLELAQAVPPVWIDFSYLTKDTLAQPSTVTLTQSVEYLFPWTIGQKWFQVQGWHQGDHLDFQPVVRTNPPTHFAVLAAAGGTMSLVCGGRGTLDPYQAHIRISHPDGNSTYYLHLDANTIRYDLIGKSIARGQFIGLLYNGVQGSGNGYQYNTNCGYGQAVHLHFGAPRIITINGYDINTVASAAFATQYGSSNTRIDGVHTSNDYNGDGKSDLFAVFRSSSGSGKTDVHILNGADSYQSFLARIVTAQGETGTDNAWAFGIGDYNTDGVPDLYTIFKSSTGSGKTELHILNGADGYQSFLANQSTILGETGNDGAWAFAIADYNNDKKPDLYAIFRSKTNSGSTEVYVVNGADNYQTYLLAIGTALGDTGSDGNWSFLVNDYNNDSRPDIYAIKKTGTGSGHTELHVLNGADGYQTFLAHQSTILSEIPDGNWTFNVLDFNLDNKPDLFAIFKSQTNSKKTEVYIADGANNYQSYLFAGATALGETGSDCTWNFLSICVFPSTTMTPSPTPSTTVTPSPTSSTTVTPSPTTMTPSPTPSTTITPSPTTMTPSPTPVTSHYSVYLPMIQR